MFSSMDNKMVSNFFTCQTCNAIFTCLNFYQQHRKEHAQSEGVELFTCSHCSFVSENNFNFNWHNMTHTKGQEHKCEICAPTEVSKNTWSNPFDIDSDTSSISVIDCSRFGCRSIATQYCDEDIDAGAEPYPLLGCLDEFNEYDDEETEEEVEDDTEDDGATQIEDDTYNYDAEEELPISNHEANNFTNHNGDDNNDNNFQEDAEGVQLGDNKHFAQHDDSHGMAKASNNNDSDAQQQPNSDVYDFKSDDDHNDDFEQQPQQPQLSHQTNGGLMIQNDTTTLPQPMLMLGQHPNPSSQPSQQPTHHLLQPASYHHHHMPTAASTTTTLQARDAQGNPIQTTFQIPAQSQAPHHHPSAVPQFIQLPNGQFAQTVPTGPGVPHHPTQFINSTHQFMAANSTPNGQAIQLVSIPSNQPTTIQTTTEMALISNEPKSTAVKSKKSKSKHAVLLPSPSNTNTQSVDTQDKPEPGDSPTGSSLKPKGHGKGNRKPRINFVSLGNGITIGTDGIRRKFHCSLCGNGKSFKTKSHLQRHMLTHTGEKPYQCNDCGSKFNQSSSLRNHMIAIHTKQFPHTCQVCGKGFLMPAVLQRHIAQTGHIADCEEDSRENNSNSSNAISANENFNNVITPIDVNGAGYYTTAFNPSNVVMSYSYAPS